ncbi:hypothetical protein [Duganella violaceipulchra]|uniref:General stress protein 17M-like domain-containing protein n=1 Tax=Duganella violaceipulchra TaxID=2849652 RepID=A0AA41L6F5_9BURK|nr:hypothetical protein [Duganella violaceicalia]MBV6325224.1 hypothetical protein [Duganella violaceicalia]MCP2012438.1 hypothetical protein [Duganella violaceicalia]
MTHTLAAVFETRAEANRAKDELIHSGYAAESITVSDSGSVAGTPRINDNESILSTIKQMFSQLLGREHADRHIYAEALNRGHVVLTIQTHGMEAADRAADIVEDFNPLDIDERETMWRASGWTGGETQRGGAGARQTGLGAQQSAPEQHGIRQREEAVDFARSEQGTLTQGSMQRGETVSPTMTGVNAPISEQSTVQRSGMRIYPRDSGAANQDSLNILRGEGEDVLYFRTHWQDTFSYGGGTYQEYDPAYRYGESMAGNPGYKDKPWEEVEPELRSNWESQHAQSSWEKFKDAVRAGWERVTK